MLLTRQLACIVVLLMLVGCGAIAQELPPNQAAPQPSSAAAPTATANPVAAATPPPTLLPTSTLPPPEPQPTLAPTLLPENAPLRIGVQVGHWRTAELPAELERFRTSTGAWAAGYNEVDVNLPVAERVVALLREQGIEAELLPATIPISYQADAFITIHADGSPSERTRGFKMATPWRTSTASQALLDALIIEYSAGTGLPQDGAITVNMRGYYAFSRRHQHAIARTTPAVIIEMGYLSNPADRALMLDDPDLVAGSIVAGLMRYLHTYDRADIAARTAPEYKLHRSTDAGATVYAAPSEGADVVFELGPDDRFVPFQERDGWYEGVVRGEWRVLGWVRKDQLIATDEPLTFPTPATGN